MELSQVSSENTDLILKLRVRWCHHPHCIRLLLVAVVVETYCWFAKLKWLEILTTTYSQSKHIHEWMKNEEWIDVEWRKKNEVFWTLLLSSTWLLRLMDSSNQRMVMFYWVNTRELFSQDVIHVLRRFKNTNGHVLFLKTDNLNRVYLGFSWNSGE